MTVLLIALLSGLAMWVWLMPRDDSRIRAVFGVEKQSRPSSPILVPLALVMFGIGMTILLGSALGILLGVAAAVAFPRAMRHVEGRAERARRERLSRQAPDAADLLAATLASGAPIRRALGVVAAAVDEPMGDVLATVASALDLGASIDEAWALGDPQGQLAEIANGFRRSARSGAPLADVLSGIAGDLRRRHRQSVEVQARVAGVRAIAPLAACFLPAFLLVGAVPIVASFATGLFTP